MNKIYEIAKKINRKHYIFATVFPKIVVDQIHDNVINVYKHHHVNETVYDNPDVKLYSDRHVIVIVS